MSWPTRTASSPSASASSARNRPRRPGGGPRPGRNGQPEPPDDLHPPAELAARTVWAMTAAADPGEGPSAMDLGTPLPRPPKPDPLPPSPADANPPAIHPRENS